MVFSKNSAQGTIEYLVIIAVVVVISLVVVGLVTNVFSSPSQEITDSSSQIGGVSSGGISVVESVIDPAGDSLIFLSNNSGDAITLTKISVGGADNNFNEQLVGLDSKTFSLSGLSSACPCVSGQKSVKCDLKIDYTTVTGILKTVYRSVNASCVSDSIAIDSSKVVSPIVPVLELGTLANPWVINDCVELQDMNLHLDGNYVLGNNIDCNISPFIIGQGFNPIGNSSTKFTGSLNGQFYVINNLYINRSTTDYIGLFGYATGKVYNIGLVDQNIIGQDYVGGIIGSKETPSILQNTFASGHVLGRDIIGGLVGLNQYTNSSQITSSYNLSSVVGRSNVGGLVGENAWGVISNCYNLGAIIAGSDNSSSVVGGIVGSNMGFVNNVYNKGVVFGDGEYVGGLIGWEIGVTSNSFNVGLVSGESDYVGGLQGDNGESYAPINSYWDISLSSKSNCYCMEYSGCNPPYLGCTSTNGQVTEYYGALGVEKLNNDGNWVAQDNNYPILSWQ